jgi:hypothetical protein
MSARIEAYLYASGTDDVLEATAGFTITEPGPVVYRATLPATARFSDALVTWQGLLNASALAGTYAITWNDQRQSVNISATGVASFGITFHGNLAAAWGYSSGIAGALDYDSDLQPLLRYDGILWGSGEIVNGDNVDLRQYNYGRHRAIAWGNVDLWDSEIHVQSSRVDTFLASYCVSGKVRVYQDSAITTAYSATNLSGYLDCYVIGISDPLEKRGRIWTTLSISLAVPRY